MNAKKLEKILDSQMKKILTGFQFTEGPVWVPDGFLLFSDIPADTIYKYEPGQGKEVFMKPSGHSNGLTLDKQGRLLICEHDRQVSRLEKDGPKKSLATSYSGNRLNSPNDIVVKSDEAIYFTDPPFGLQDRSVGKELDFSGVYRLEQDGTLSLLESSLELPNGLAFSPDESILYVDDSNSGNVYAFNVTGEGLLEDKRIFASVGNKGGDGMKTDIEGNILVTGPDGINVFNPEGHMLGVIECPETPANIAWGDNDYKTLYITARTSLYSIRVKTGGKSLIPDFTPTPIF
jgi:sugar lactone lactonase YvrE